MVLKEFLAAQFSASASLRSKVSRLSPNCSWIQVSGLIGVSFTYGLTFFFIWCFAACIRVLLLHCRSCFYEFVFSSSAVVFVLFSYSFSDGGLCALVTCLPPRPFFGCPRRDCNVSMDICRFILFHVHSTGNELHVPVEDM